MKTKYIYIVIGETGEYSDKHIWHVMAFRTEKKANIWARICQRDADMWEEERQGEYSSPPTNLSKYDKYMRMDYTGTTYSVEKVESKI